VFNERVKSAKSLIEEATAVAAEYSPTALLAEIRRLGGIKPFEKGMWNGRPNSKKFREEFESIVQAFARRDGRGQRGGGSIFRTEGLALDDLVQQLHENPKWEHIVSNDTNEFMAMLEDIAHDRTIDSGFGTPDLEAALAQTGVKPGHKWWEPQAKAVTMAAPVDLRGVKAALKPIYDRMMRQLPVTQQQASPGLKALENIVNGEDFAPLTQVDADLGAIKSISRGRGSDLPELRDVSQGLAAEAVKQLDAAVRAAAEGLGPEAIAALRAGRKATVSKVQSGEVLKRMREEPVQAFQQATYAKDAGIAQLRRMAALAPNEMPKVGRAFLDDLMRKAMADGGFDKSKTLASAWENLGPQTRLLLFRDAAYIADLDNFFRLAKKIAENPNPSGTARVSNVLNLATALPSYAIAKLLYSSKGIKTLTNGMRVNLRVGGPRVGVAGHASAQKPQPVAPSTAEREREARPVAVPAEQRKPQPAPGPQSRTEPAMPSLFTRPPSTGTHIPLPRGKANRPFGEDRFLDAAEFLLGALGINDSLGDPKASTATASGNLLAALPLGALGTGRRLVGSRSWVGNSAPRPLGSMGATLNRKGFDGVHSLKEQVADRLRYYFDRGGATPRTSDWRGESEEYIGAFNGDREMARRTGRLIGATSPTTDVPANTRQTVAAHLWALEHPGQLMTAADATSMYPKIVPAGSKVPNVNRALSAEPLSGDKVEAFSGFMLGEPRIPIDVHAIWGVAGSTKKLDQEISGLRKVMTELEGLPLRGGLTNTEIYYRYERAMRNTIETFMPDTVINPLWAQTWEGIRDGKGLGPQGGPLDILRAKGLLEPGAMLDVDKLRAVLKEKGWKASAIAALVVGIQAEAGTRGAPDAGPQ
jgi:hypothetical protein